MIEARIPGRTAAGIESVLPWVWHKDSGCRRYSGCSRRSGFSRKKGGMSRPRHRQRHPAMRYRRSFVMSLTGYGSRRTRRTRDAFMEGLGVFSRWQVRAVPGYRSSGHACSVRIRASSGNADPAPWPRTETSTARRAHRSTGIGPAIRAPARVSMRDPPHGVRPAWRRPPAASSPIRLADPRLTADADRGGNRTGSRRTPSRI